MQIARIYRNYFNKNEFRFNISIKESDIFFISDKDIKEKAYKFLLKFRNIIENHINVYPEFLSSLSPLTIPEENLSEILKDMYIAGKKAGVGPFASVAGAIAEHLGKKLKNYCNEIIIENGGDIYIDTKCDRIINIQTIKIKNLGIKITKEEQPLSICSSSAKIGHSLSFGKADLVTVIGNNGAISDAFATKICNEIKSEKDLQIVLNNVKEKTIKGIIAIFKDKIAIKGNIKFVKVE